MRGASFGSLQSSLAAGAIFARQNSGSSLMFVPAGASYHLASKEARVRSAVISKLHHRIPLVGPSNAVARQLLPLGYPG